MQSNLTNLAFSFLSNTTEEKDECIWQNFHPLPNNACELARTFCKGKYFNILALHYCYIKISYISLPMFFLIMFLCFYFAGTTGHYYSAKILGAIAEKMHMSQNLAGLTLIALGNMSTDVIVAILAGAESGVKTSFCSLLGGGNLILGMIMSTVIFLGKGVKVVGVNFIRDLSTYLIGLGVVAFYGFKGEVKLIEAILFLCLYFLYVGICVLMEKNSKKSELEENLYSVQEDFVTKIYDEDDDEIINENINDDSNENKDNANSDQFPGENFEVGDNKKEKKIKKKEWDINEVMQNLFMVKKAVTRASLGGARQSINFSESHINVANYSKFKIMLLDMYLSEKPWEKKNTFEKIFSILVNTVFDSIRKLTIPPFEQSNWNKTLFTFWPITVNIFLSFSLNLFNLYRVHYIKVIIYYSMMLILCYIINRKTYRGSLPNCPWMLLIPALLTAILWIYTSSSILMNIITAIKVLLPIKLPDTFLIMTIVAYGNATPDFVVECSLANGGYAEMALSGAIGGPVFGLLCGFGVCLIQGCLAEKSGTTDFQIFKIRVIIMAFILVVFDVIQLMINGIIMKFDIKRKTCIFGYSSYFVYFLGIVLISFVFQWDDKV